MKKIFVVFILFCALLLISCNDDNPNEADSFSNGESSEQETNDIVPETNNSQDSDTKECILDENILESSDAHYFAFEGIGLINDLEQDQPTPVDFVKTNLFGIEGKDLDNSEAYFLSTNIPDTNDYKNNKSDFPAITIKVINDSDKLSTTIVFANVPISYIDILKEHDKKFHNVLPAAPITNIVDFLYTEDGKFVKQCIIAASKYGIVEELGQETALGKTQICYENNNTFAAGETFNIAMLAKLAVGQEIVDTYSDINSIDELCTCFDLDNSADEAIDCSTIIWENEEPSEIEELDRDEEELEDDSDEVSENDDCGSRAYWTDAYGCVCYDKNAYFEYYEGCKCRQKYRIENGE